MPTCMGTHNEDYVFGEFLCDFVIGSLGCSELPRTLL